MHDYELKKSTLTKEMKEKAKKLAEFIRDDFEGDRIGKVTTEFEFVEYQAMKEIKRDGRKVYVHDPNGEITYELEVRFHVPLLYLSFDAEEIRLYRWNVRRSDFEHEETAIF